MRQEHRFVADLYRYIAPFINTAKPIFLSLDGEAAKNGVGEKHFDDPAVPDMWFTLIGGIGSTLLEAKIIGGGKITIGQSQLCAWRSGGHGGHKPSAWVAANEPLDKFFYWPHSEFLPILDSCTSQKKYPKVKLPTTAKEFSDVRSLALELLRNH